MTERTITAMSDKERLAADLRAAAEAFELAQRHCLIAAEHLEENQMARTGAHAFAARGDLARGLAALDAAAENFAAHSKP